MKHGPLALVEPDLAMIMVITRDPVYSKCINALQQVDTRQIWINEHILLLADRLTLDPNLPDWTLDSILRTSPQVTARGGRPLLICEEGDEETQRICCRDTENPAEKCLTIPHTVDCLQVILQQMRLFSSFSD